MSDYPTFDQLRGTRFAPFDNTKVQVSEGGDRLVIEPWLDDATKLGIIGEYEVFHKTPSADRTTLESHYTTNRRNSFDFVDLSRPGVTWLCLWAGEPQFSRLDRLGSQFRSSSLLWVISNDE